MKHHGFGMADRDTLDANKSVPSGVDPRQSITAQIEQKLPDLPAGQREQIITVVREVVQHHSGPLPPPSMLSDYDGILPGLAERIVSMAERDLLHHQNLQTTALRAEARERLVGQMSALLITLAALGSSAWVAVSGYPVTGGLLGGATLLTIISTLIGGREYLMSRLRRAEIEQSNKKTPGPAKRRR